MAKPRQYFHYPFPVNGFYTGTLKVSITHSQYHCTTAHIKSSNHTLSLHRLTSNSSTTNFPWLTSTLQSNSVNCVVASNVFRITPRHGPRTENTAPLLLHAILLGFPHDRYLATPSVRWLLPNNKKHCSYCCVHVSRGVY
jgi:hypothetical protein